MPRVALAKWGNNLALRLPKGIVEELGVREGTEVTVAVNEGSLVATPTNRQPTLEELVGQITAENRHDATEWGPPVGREVW